MQQIQRANEKVRNTNNIQVIIVDELPGVPGYNKYGECNYYGYQFNYCMEKQVTFLQTEAEDENQCRYKKDGPVVLL